MAELIPCLKKKQPAAAAKGRKQGFPEQRAAPAGSFSSAAVAPSLHSAFLACACPACAVPQVELLPSISAPQSSRWGPGRSRLPSPHHRLVAPSLSCLPLLSLNECGSLRCSNSTSAGTAPPSGARPFVPRSPHPLQPLFNQRMNLPDKTS